MTLPVAALGGGHGLSATLQALRHVTSTITAIVTVADDGGSSGRLRDEFDVLPPGDLRMALSALCSSSDWGHTWRDALQYRFPGSGPLGGHALGNLLIVALWQSHDDPVAGLDLVARLLQAEGRVLPMAAVPLQIAAQVRGVDPRNPDGIETLIGQANIARTPGCVEAIQLIPTEPPAYPESVAAIENAEWIILGPGSWFTSVMPHLLVPQLRDALAQTKAKKMLVLNLKPDQGETQGYAPVNLLESFATVGSGITLDVVLADYTAVDEDDEAELVGAAERLGAQLHIADMSRPTSPAEHDPLRYAAALADIIGTTRA